MPPTARSVCSFGRRKIDACSVSLGSVSHQSYSPSFVGVLVNSGREVGVAVLQLHDFKLRVLQFQDHLTFPTLRSRIHLYDAKDVLVPSTILNGTLCQFLCQDGCNLVAVPRRNFNESEGYLLLEKLAIPSADSSLGDHVHSRSVPISLSGHAHHTSTSSSLREIAGCGYLALSAACAVIRHAECALGLALLPKSLVVQVVSVSGHMVLDLHTARRLNVVPSNPADNFDLKSSLFGILNHCRTNSGSRLLRSCLLSPITDVHLLHSRAELVEFFLHQPAALAALQVALQHVGRGGSGHGKRVDVEGALLTLASQSQNPSDRTSRRLLVALLHLKDLLQSLDPLREVYSGMLSLFGEECSASEQSSNGCESVIRQLEEYVSPDALAPVVECILSVIDADACSPAAAAGASHQEGRIEPFAEESLLHSIRPGVSPVLDVARTLALESIAAAERHLAELRTSIAGPMTLHYVQDRGFYLTVGESKRVATKRNRGEAAPQRSSPAANLDPNTFIRIVIRGNVATCTTDPLLRLSARFVASHAEFLNLADGQLGSLVNRVRLEYISRVYALLDSVAFVDAVQSLAAFGSSVISRAGVNITFPTYIGDDDACDIEGVFDPILLSSLGSTRCVPVTTMIDSTRRCILVSGPNSSGKTAFLRAMGRLAVLAQCGAPVPGTKFVWRPCDAIITRLGYGDNISTGSSSFVVELEDAAFALDAVRGRSLLLLDELGRGTHFIDGTSIAYAILEKLLTSRAALGATVFATTHFPSLSLLSVQHPGRVDLLQLNVSVTASRIEPLYTTSQGHCAGLLYGIALARELGMPAAVVEAAAERSVALRGVASLSVSATSAASKRYIAAQLAQVALLDGPAAAERLAMLRVLVGGGH